MQVKVRKIVYLLHAECVLDAPLAAIHIFWYKAAPIVGQRFQRQCATEIPRMHALHHVYNSDNFYIFPEVQDRGSCILQFERWVIPKQGRLLSFIMTGGAFDIIGCCQQCIETDDCNVWIYCDELDGCESPAVVRDRVNTTAMPFQGCMLWNALPSLDGDALEYISSNAPDVVSSAINTFPADEALDGFDYYPAQILQEKDLAPCEIPAAFAGLNYSASNQEYCHVYENIETVAQVCSNMRECDGFMYTQSNDNTTYGRLLSGVQENTPLETLIDPFSATWIQKSTPASYSIIHYKAHHMILIIAAGLCLLDMCLN